MRQRWIHGVALAALGSVALGCGCTKSSGTSPAGDANPQVAGSAAAPPGSGSAAAPGSVALAEPAPITNWVEAVRVEQWGDAARLIDALPPAERDSNEVKYVRARAAIALGDPARAATLLDQLEQQLPLLRDDILRHRAEAQLEAGPHEAAGKYFAARPNVTDLSRAALAFERAGKHQLAQAAADHAIRKAQQQKRSADSQALARAVRARVAELLGKTKLAALDLRWLCTMVPTSEQATGADERLGKLAPRTVLTKTERYDRALAFARTGRVAETDAELDRLGQAPGQAVRKGDVLYARAWALYVSREDYARASELFTQAAQAGSSDVIRDQFYAARAKSRANDDEQAIKMYAALARRFSRSSYAERARYLGARLHYIMGKWDDAVSGYTAYLKRYGKEGRFRKTSEYERAVAWTVSQKWELAIGAFQKLADQEQEALRLATYRQLRGVALAGAGKKEPASQAFRDVIRDFPLSFPALASAARLAQLGEAVPAPIEPASSVPALPALVIKLPPKVQLLQRIGLDRDAEAELRLHESSIRSAHGARGDEALCQVYGQLSIAARRYRAGRNAGEWSTLRRAPSARTQWVHDCMYPTPYLPLVRAAEHRNQLPPYLVYAIMRQESAFQSAVVSPARAVGLMQLIPPTAQKVASELGVEYEPGLLVSPPHNIRMGAHYLGGLLRMFGGNVALAAASYNAGPGAVSRWLESGETLPLDLFVARIPYGETRQYVRLVLANQARYAYLNEGESAIPTLALDLPQGLRASAGAY